MALHSLYCADVPLRNCSLTPFTLSSLIFFKRADVTHDTRGHLCKLYHILVLTT